MATSIHYNHTLCLWLVTHNNRAWGAYATLEEAEAVLGGLLRGNEEVVKMIEDGRKVS